MGATQCVTCRLQSQSVSWQTEGCTTATSRLPTYYRRRRPSLTCRPSAHQGYVGIAGYQAQNPENPKHRTLSPQHRIAAMLAAVLTMFSQTLIGSAHTACIHLLRRPHSTGQCKLLSDCLQSAQLHCSRTDNAVAMALSVSHASLVV